MQWVNELHRLSNLVGSAGLQWDPVISSGRGLRFYPSIGLRHEELQVVVAADLGRRHQKRGLLLNYPESIAIVTNEIMEGARDLDLRAGTAYFLARTSASCFSA